MSRLACAGLAALIALPASAQSWGATAEPQEFENGTRYCMIWLGDAAPLMNFMAMSDGLNYVVISDEFAEVPEGAPVSFSFEDGTSLPVGSAEKIHPEENPGFIAGGVADITMFGIGIQMSVRSGGAAPMTVTAGGKTQDFHLNSVAGELSMFENCRGKL